MVCVVWCVVECCSGVGWGVMCVVYGVWCGVEWCVVEGCDVVCCVVMCCVVLCCVVLCRAVL